MEFTENLHALCALRELNNNPKYYEYTAMGLKTGKKKIKIPDRSRLMVEFAVENHGKLKLREKRLQAAEQHRSEKEKLASAQVPEHSNGESFKEKKKSKSKSTTVNRGARQRANKRARQVEGGEKPQETATMMTTPPLKKAKSSAAPKAETVTHMEKTTSLKTSRRERKEKKSISAELRSENIVQQYKQQLFGNSNSVGKSTETPRWFNAS